MRNDIEFIQKLVNHIEKNLAEEINVIKLAESFDISPWHFQRLFKSLVGDTLGAYIRGRRLTQAAHLLLDSNLNLIDIAFDIGFSSHEAFTRSFKSHFKLSPKSFRKMRPSILLNKKPLLSEVLFHHLAKEITRDPIISIRQEQTIIGFDTTIPSPFYTNENYCDALYTPWMELLKRQSEISNRLPGSFMGLSISHSGNFTEDTIDYIAGSLITTDCPTPAGMVSYSLPEQSVAMFEIQTVDTDTVAKTIDYIYGYWLPNSSYLRGNGNDYELFEGITSFEIPDLTSKYVIPIVPK